MVEVSDYMKNGGGNAEEWPWKLALPGKESMDKWIVECNAAWVVFRFERPILIRGYGLVSAGDVPSRDPKHWNFMIKDALKVLTKADYGMGQYIDIPWEKVDE